MNIYTIHCVDVRPKPPERPSGLIFIWLKKLKNIVFQLYYNYNRNEYILSDDTSRVTINNDVELYTEGTKVIGTDTYHTAYLIQQ